MEALEAMAGAAPAIETLQRCWFCGFASHAACECGRDYCDEHAHDNGTRCMICALAYGLYEQAGEQEPLSGLLMLSLSAAANDPYIVVPAPLQRVRPLPLMGVERVVSSVVKMLGSEDESVRRRAVAVLAAATNSWPTLDPSPLAENKYGFGLLAVDQVRTWLLYVLKHSRARSQEATALAIFDKLRSADFRDLYPGIRNNLQSLTVSHLTRRVNEVFDAIEEFYPVHSPLVNERCELMVYEHYANRVRGAGEMMQRLYGPLLRYSPTLRHLLKKGTWLSSRSRFDEWYYGEAEPV